MVSLLKKCFNNFPPACWVSNQQFHRKQAPIWKMMKRSKSFHILWRVRLPRKCVSQKSFGLKSAKFHWEFERWANAIKSASNSSTTMTIAARLFSLSLVFPHYLIYERSASGSKSNYPSLFIRFDCGHNLEEKQPQQLPTTALALSLSFSSSFIFCDVCYLFCYFFLFIFRYISPSSCWIFFIFLPYFFLIYLIKYLCNRFLYCLPFSTLRLQKVTFLFCVCFSFSLFTWMNHGSYVFFNRFPGLKASN